MKTIFVIVLLMLSGCEAVRSQTADARSIRHDCEMTTPEGLKMQCSHTLTRDETDEGEGVSVSKGIPVVK